MTLWTQVADFWHHTPFADHSTGLMPHHRVELLPVSAPEWAVSHGLLGELHLSTRYKIWRQIG